MKLGIDLGGSKIESIVLNSSSEELFRKRLSTPKGDYSSTLHSIKTLIEQSEHALNTRFHSVGVGIPGNELPDSNLIQNANSTCLIGKPLRLDLEALLNKRVFLENDANCFTLSEATDGSAARYKLVFGVILGTGVGGGIVFNQSLLNGPNKVTGEWGHLPLPHLEASDSPAFECYCTKSNCIETYLSGPALSVYYQRKTKELIPVEEIATRAKSGDSSASQILEEFETRLAKALSLVVNLIDPDAIVLGGGLGNLERLYTQLPKKLEAHLFQALNADPNSLQKRLRTVILKPKFGDSSGVRGAAWLNPHP